LTTAYSGAARMNYSRLHHIA